MPGQRRVPLAGGQAEAGGGVGLVDGNVHRMQGRPRHAHKGGQHAGRIDQRNVHWHAQCAGRLQCRAGRLQGGSAADDALHLAVDKGGGWAGAGAVVVRHMDVLRFKTP